MAWKKVLPMEERIRFIVKAKEKNDTISNLCLDFGISRKTGYKWIDRYKNEGFEGLKERSRRPKSCPHMISSEVEQLLIFDRLQHPTWGPKKLRTRLIRSGYKGLVPATSTIGDMLKRRGLVKSKKRRQKNKIHRGELTEAVCPNHVWAVDFKGWFRTKDNKRCDPLTITDIHSRYLLECRALNCQKYEDVRQVFEKVFKRYGLPKIIRSDNGSPFASQGVCGLSRLSVWWIMLGIEAELIDPGHPEQNGQHERMHRTLKAETTKPPMSNIRTQQRKFDSFRHEFNYERPHEALNMKYPAEEYKRSIREYKGSYKKIDYSGEYICRKVRHNGEIKWKGRFRYIGQALRGVKVGLKKVDNYVYEVYFGKIKLGLLDEKVKEGLKKEKVRGKK